MKNANIGANILYRYQDGALTGQPLWDPATGEFPHGAVVAGVNDVPGESLYDVQERLNVNRNGCAFPAGYAGQSYSPDQEPPVVAIVSPVDGAIL